MDGRNSFRVAAIDPGSTVGFAIAEVSELSPLWRMLHVGNTSGIRGTWSILEGAFIGGLFPGIIILENYHIRDVRVASSEATMTTLEIWGSVRAWGATHILPPHPSSTPQVFREHYPVRSQEPPATQHVQHWRRILGKNPTGNQADHPYVAAAHIGIWLARNVTRPLTLEAVNTEEVWVPLQERT